MEFTNNPKRSNRALIRFRQTVFLAFISIIAFVLASILACTIFCDTCYLRLSPRIVFSSVAEYQDSFSINNKKSLDWCRLQKWRVNWKDMIAVCEGKMTWDKREINSPKRTDARKSYIMKWELQNPGKFSRFWIQSVNTNGQIKTFGGDSWRVYIRQGPQSVVPIITDHDNGLYEVMMLITEPGNYSANIYLDYTLCDGFREPPIGWFINGTDYGTYLEPKEGILGNIEQDHINSLLKNQLHFNFTIYGHASSIEGTVDDKGCSTKCSMLWDGYGYWKTNTWFPYKPELDSTVRVQTRPKKSGTLWVYGDSLGMRFVESINKHSLCTEIFERCGYTYNWIYEVKDKRHPLKVKSNFNKTIIINKIRYLLERQDINQFDSVFIFSLGVHFPISLSFTAYQDLIDSVISVLLEDNKDGRRAYKGTAIWKTTAAIEKEKVNRIPWPAKPLNYTLFRFLTTQRNQLFHSYSMNSMCRAGIKVLDVYPLSAAFNEGTLDYVHYKDTVFYPAANLIQNYVIKGRQLREK